MDTSGQAITQVEELTVSFLMKIYERDGVDKSLLRDLMIALNKAFDLYKDNPLVPKRLAYSCLELLVVMITHFDHYTDHRLTDLNAAYDSIFAMTTDRMAPENLE